MTQAPRVTIAGGGVGGLTAALRLAERGYRVKLYEQKPTLGGDLASRRHAGVELDVYPHMYCNWYRNFWRLLRDAGGDRDELFTRFEGYAQLRAGEFPRFTTVADIYSPWHIVHNLFSGVGPPADLWVYGYATIDLLAETLQPTVNLKNMSVDGFLDARPYVTPAASDAYDTFITRVWGIPSYLASAADFRQYLRYSLADPTPAFWLPRGSAMRQVIEPLTAALERAGVEIVREVQVTSVSCDERRVTRIGLQRAVLHPDSGTWVGRGRRWAEAVDELILAVPAPALVTLVRNGGTGTPIVRLAPKLAEVSRLQTVPVPIINLFFTRKLGRIPAEPVGLFASKYCLAFTDISQTWEDVSVYTGQTVLAVSASDIYALPGTGPDDDAQAMLVELARFLDFDPGSAWGESPDIDWARTRYERNLDAQLFVNEAGSDVWRPEATCAEISNLALAGDLCDNDIGLTTVESAVVTGLHAAQAIVHRRGLGGPVDVIPPPGGLPRDAIYTWLRYAWAPSAAMASWWSRAASCLGQIPSRADDARVLLRALLKPGAR
jgi:predicted NAD/FAD-dependent oxidoreductase